MELRIKLPILIVVLVTCTLVISGALTYVYSSQLLLEKSKDLMKANAFRTGEAIHLLVQSEIRKTEILASKQQFRNSLIARSQHNDVSFFDPNNSHFLLATEALRDAYSGSMFHEKFWLGDPDGVVIASSAERLETGSIKVPDRPYFIEAMQGRTSVSGTINSRANGKAIIVTAAPIKDQSGHILGVVGNSIYTSFFSNHLQGIKVNARGTMYILDSNGMIVAHSTDQHLIQTKTDNERLLSIAQETSSMSIDKGELEITDHGVDKYIAYSKVPKANWVVVVEDDIKDIKSPLSELAAKYMIVLVAAIVISLLLFTTLLWYLITKPLVQILNIMKRAGAGDLDVRLELRSNDEFGMIGRALNNMLFQIRELMQTQERAAHLQLENIAERERTRISEQLRKVQMKLNATLELEKLKPLALEEFYSLVTYDRVSVWICTNGQCTLVSEQTSNDTLSPYELDQINKWYIQAKHMNEPLLTRRSDGRTFVLVVPFMIYGQEEGIKVIERMDRPFERHEEELVLNFSIQAAAAISNAKLYQQKERMAVTDELTKIYNRRHFLDLANQCLKRSQRHGAPLSVLIFDIDYFKRINDELGHLVGDMVLRGLADMLIKAVPKDSVLARFGGEEFVVLLPDMSKEESLKVAEALRSAVSDYEFHTEHKTFHITISVGVAEYTKGMELTSLLHEADKALYQAKHRGRNCVVQAGNNNE